MSIWSDIQDRSAGISEREEDKKRYITLDKIEEILKSMKVGTKEGEYPPVFDLNIFVEHFDGNKIGIIKSKTYRSDKGGWVYSTNGRKDVKLNNPKAGDIIIVGAIMAEPQVIDGDQYNFYFNLEAIFNGKSWIVKETPAKAKLVIKDFIKKENN